MAYFEHAPRGDADEFIGDEGQLLKSVITPQDFLPDRSSEWARLCFAGRKGGFELVVGRMIGVVEGAEEREHPPFDGVRKARYFLLHGFFEMTARLDADELTRALDADPELANARGWAPERGRYPGLVECNIAASDAILPEAFARRVMEAFETAKMKKIEFHIDVCLQATGKASPSSSPYVWLIVSWVDGQAFRFRAGRPMMISPREVLRPNRSAL
jgi:hypothetical protein